MNAYHSPSDIYLILGLFDLNGNKVLDNALKILLNKYNISISGVIPIDYVKIYLIIYNISKKTFS